MTVINAWTQHGWSCSDHLIDDSRLADMIGRRYQSLAALKREADRRCDPRGYPTVEYIGPDGATYRYDGSAGLGIPGRHVPAVTRIYPDGCRCGAC